MAVKGRVQSALERATDRTAGIPDIGYGEGRGRDVRGQASPFGGAQREAPGLHPLPRFRQAAYDREQCRKSRVLAPGADGPWGPPAAAAFRMLRTRVLHRASANGWQTIGVTSPGMGDGKSLTSLNLALAVARERNHNVFLIDLDMRNPKMCRYLGTAPPVQINRLFMGEASPEDVLFQVGIENLTLAGTLTSTDQASEMLATGRVEELFGYIRSITPHPLIVLDLPPVLSTDDALIVAPKIDANLLVLSEGRSRRDGAAKALEFLAEFDLAGIVLNRSRAGVTDYYYSYY